MWESWVAGWWGRAAGNRNCGRRWLKTWQFISPYPAVPLLFAGGESHMEQFRELEPQDKFCHTFFFLNFQVPNATQCHVWGLWRKWSSRELEGTYLPRWVIDSYLWLRWGEDAARHWAIKETRSTWQTNPLSDAVLFSMFHDVLCLYIRMLAFAVDFGWTNIATKRCPCGFADHQIKGTASRTEFVGDGRGGGQCRTWVAGAHITLVMPWSDQVYVTTPIKAKHAKNKVKKSKKKPKI